MEYEPDLTLHGNTKPPLWIALMEKNIAYVKCLLHHATKHNIRGITWHDDYDLVLSSLNCNDYELLKALLEYELEHPLDETDERDLPRILSILNYSSSKTSNLTVTQFVQAEGWNNAEKFLEELMVLASSII